jgi:pyridoxamine 5'-phosphate oxidase
MTVMTNLADLRREYSLAVLDESAVAATPLGQFDKWFKEALKAELPEPNAMTLATCDAQARPSARVC